MYSLNRKVKDMIIRTVRFAKSLKFYDGHIGLGSNTCHFWAGIEYILCLWCKHGFFASDQDFGKVKIYACSAAFILEEDTDSKREKKKRQNKEQYEKNRSRYHNAFGRECPLLGRGIDKGGSR